jgi:cysteine-rich repeat protein
MRSSATGRFALVVSVLAVSWGPTLVRAERLFTTVPGVPSPDARIAEVQALALDAAGLAGLRSRAEATLTDFPLGKDATATLAVTRFEPFAAGARAEVVEAGGVRRLSLPDQLYYRGAVVGEPGSKALVIAGRNTVHGFVASGGTVYRFGADRGGVYRSWALRDADPAAFPAPPVLCGNDAHPDLVNLHPGRSASTGTTSATPPTAAFSPTLLIEVAVDTDQELLGIFGGSNDALAYLADLAAAASAIYDADTDVRVVFRYIRLWATTDPWAATTTFGMLTEVKDYWNLNEGAVARDVVHFVSGKGVIGGIAYLDVLCNSSFGYGVSTVFGAFDVMDPSDTWDVVVFTHELGHNVGSVHTHCYVPPLDMCYSGESGCYSGATSLPSGGGTIMSYCHLLSGGMSNINLTFGTTVSGVLRTEAEAGSCIGLPCGDGILDTGEDCDDGNITNGDCCSSTCTAEPDGGSCDDGESCTTSDECASGVCTGTPVTNGTPCDDGSVCTTDACSSGVCVGTATPVSSGCKLPTLPLTGKLVIKDKAINKKDLVLWKWTKGGATTLPDLGDPTTSDDYELCVYGPAPTLIFNGHVPAGGTCTGLPCWKSTATGFIYKDPEQTPDGMFKLTLKSGIAGTSKAVAKGKGGNLDMPVLGSLPLPITVQLRRTGQCWESTFSTALLNDAATFKAQSD